MASVPSDGSIPPEIVEYFSKFYQFSDSPPSSAPTTGGGNHEEYADFFTPDGTIIMASNRVQGREEIIKLRQGMWEKVAKRSHVPKQLFGLGKGPSDADEVMLYGTVDYTLKDGRATTVDWSARAHFVKQQGGELKMDFYQVYLDTAAMANAK